METNRLVHPDHYARMSGAELRRSFLVTGLFAKGEVRLHHWEGERTLIGGAVPHGAPLTLEPPGLIKADGWSQRRETGIANLGGQGCVTVDGTKHDLGRRDILYVGRGAKSITLESASAGGASAQGAPPACFYLVSQPAHAEKPHALVREKDAETATIGSAENASARTLRRYIHARGASSCQLVMGITQIHSGSAWNTMPPHTHTRRTEIYLYFDLAPDAILFHFMGPPNDTKHIVVRDFEAVLSPSWSMHFGAGTSPYAFVWSMGGENQEFEDMQGVSLNQLT
jgi:4-deoxy-L-threo-5-hexosulose-uronate ketol-isomerase